MNPQSTIGHYRVVSKLGEGGMGAVYRATDTKLNRDVAIKVLPDSYASDPDRLARFTREAQVLASLNHPNIAGIYGVEDRALVLELVEGPTLADLIAKGPLPVEEALAIGRQIADALEYAHGRGVIHRDLKPANVKLTPEGKVKVLDFGLAKALAPDAGAADPMSSPTKTIRATLAGVIMGTAGYMSPEQARGKPVDRRTDVWAFGCVLYEMLTGRRMFGGETLTDYAVAVSTEEPAWSALPPGSPVELLRLCLQKDPQRRLRDIGDAALISGLTDSAPVQPAIGVSRAARLPWAIAGVLAVVIAAMAPRFVVYQKPDAARPVTRLTLPIAPMTSFTAFAVSPDGRRIAVTGAHGSALNQLFLREMDGEEFKALPGTSGAEAPFFSPDGEWVGFRVNDKLQKIRIEGGAPTVLAGNAFGGAVWAAGGLVASMWDQGGGSNLTQIPAEGGTGRSLGVTVKVGDYQFWPSVLPDGRSLLFSTGHGGGRVASPSLSVALTAFGSGNAKAATRILAAGFSPLYVPTGHILFVRDTDLIALPFSASKMQVTGPEAVVIHGVGVDDSVRKAFYDVSRDGTLFYSAGFAESGHNNLVWVDRSGKVQPVGTPEHDYWDPRVSPDGKHIAALIREGDAEIWNYGTERGTLTRVTFDPDEDETPIWSPDGQWLTYSSARKARRYIFRRRADGTGPEETLWVTEHHAHVESWAPDGRTLLVDDRSPDTADDIWALVLDSEGNVTARPLLNSRFHETQARVSPDGKWLAYVSDESGRPEVYVQSYPSLGGKQQISSQGGQQPVWGPGGRELFYRSGGEVMAVTISPGTAFSPSVPHALFADTFVEPRESDHSYFDVSPDGRRFVMVKAAGGPAPVAQLNVVVNWFEELKAKAPLAAK